MHGVSTGTSPGLVIRRCKTPLLQKVACSPLVAAVVGAKGRRLLLGSVALCEYASSRTGHYTSWLGGYEPSTPGDRRWSRGLLRSLVTGCVVERHRPFNCASKEEVARAVELWRALFFFVLPHRKRCGPSEHARAEGYSCLFSRCVGVVASRGVFAVSLRRGPRFRSRGSEWPSCNLRLRGTRLGPRTLLPSLLLRLPLPPPPSGAEAALAARPGATSKMAPAVAVSWRLRLPAGPGLEAGPGVTLAARESWAT